MLHANKFKRALNINRISNVWPIYSIDSFEVSTKDNNNLCNSIRENIISSVINKNIPDYYYLFPKWEILRKGVNNYIGLIAQNYSTLECIPTGGRAYKYDFNLIVDNNQKYNLEFKFNASCVADLPQFVSPVKPSQYMSKSYEEYYYDNYFPEDTSIEKPERETYLKEIGSCNPPCMVEYKELYKNNIIFNKKCNYCMKKSISEFIKHTDLHLDICKVSSYLKNTQKDKTYMLYKNGVFYIETLNNDDYELISYTKSNVGFIAKCKSGKSIEIRLRWKNCNGIAFPAFQISFIN